MKFNYKEVFLVPNLITIFRLFLTIPISYIAFNYNKIVYSNYILIAFILLAFVSDLADGYVARKTGQISEVGKLLDPLSDKILTAILIILFWMIGLVPLAYLIILLFRDIIIFIGGIILAKKIGSITPSNYFGKITILSIGIFFLALLILGVKSEFSLFMMYLSGIMSVISIFVYFIRGIKLYRSYGNIR